MVKRKGFTLVELMVVILIVAILAAVAIPILRGRIDAAKWSEGKAMMGSIASAVRTYTAAKGPNAANPTLDFAQGSTSLGFSPGDLTGTYFADGDFALTAVNILVQPPTFMITCKGGSQPEAPTTPEGGYTLTGNPDGTVIWSQ